MIFSLTLMKKKTNIILFAELKSVQSHRVHLLYQNEFSSTKRKKSIKATSLTMQSVLEIYLD